MFNHDCLISLHLIPKAKKSVTEQNSLIAKQMSVTTLQNSPIEGKISVMNYMCKLSYFFFSISCFFYYQKWRTFQTQTSFWNLPQINPIASCKIKDDNSCNTFLSFQIVSDRKIAKGELQRMEQTRETRNSKVECRKRNQEASTSIDGKTRKSCFKIYRWRKWIDNCS